MRYSGKPVGKGPIVTEHTMTYGFVASRIHLFDGLKALCRKVTNLRRVHDISVG